MTEHWASFMLTPAEIYRQLTEGADTPTLKYEQANTEAEREAEDYRAGLVKSLANTIQSEWQGEVGSSAYGAAMPLSERMLENAAKLNQSQNLLSRQIDSFNTARDSVRPVSDPPQMSVDEKFPFDVDHDKAVQEYQDTAQNNITVYRAYDDASHYNQTNLPQEYNTVSRSSGNVSVEQPADVIKVGEPGPDTGGPRSARPGDSGEPGNSGPVSSGSYPGGSGSSGYPAGPGGSQTNPNDYRPAPPSSQPLPSYPAPGQPSPVSTAPGSGFVGGVPVGYSGGEFGPRAGGPGGPGGGRGPGGGGPGGGGSGGGVRGPLGSGGGALAAEEAAARRAAAQAAGSGARAGGVGAMGGPVGAGRGKDDEDAEHKRKVLIEGDGEALFGSDVLTAPEVIGDDEYED